MLARLFETVAVLFGTDAQLPTLLPVLLDAALKGAIILLAALALSRLLRRASAATRHLVWLLALISLLVLPALRQVIPVWQLSLPAALRPVTFAAPAVTLPPALGISQAKITDLAAVAAEAPLPDAPIQATSNKAAFVPPVKQVE